MKIFSVTGLALGLCLVAASAWALPQGKPFQELQASIDTLAGEVADSEARITQLEDTLALLSDDVVKNADAIAAIEDELAILNDLIEQKQAIFSGACPAGFALNYVDPDGVISCVTAGQSVQREVIYGSFYVSPNRAQVKKITCSPGNVLVGGTADYAGGIRGTAKDYWTETYKAVNNPAPFAAYMNVTAMCISTD